MPDPDAPIPSVPLSKAVPRNRTRLSLVWFIPLVAALAGVWIAVTRVLSEGPKITIVFKSAEGLEAGKTKIHYNGVDIGTVTTIELSDDHQSVITTVQMAPKTEGFLAEDTKFWVVRPRISGANVTGLGTLISGAYIGLEIGNSKATKREFVALETPPIVTGEVPGRLFKLKTPDLGSLDNGTPIFFRRLQVGQVASYELDPDGNSLTVTVFVQAPYDQYVNPQTRFWHASGIDLSLSASGLTVQTQSVLSVLIGGIAFETAATDPVLPPAEANTVFTLFQQPGRGLQAAGPQPADLRALLQGRGPRVNAWCAGRVPRHSGWRGRGCSRAIRRQDPGVLGAGHYSNRRTATRREDSRPEARTDLAPIRRRFMDNLIAHGVRAQLRSGNLLTGSALVAFDFFPGAPPATIDWSQNPVQLPTIPGQLQTMEASVEDIIKKLDKMPVNEIAEGLQKTMADLDLTLQSARGTLDNAKTIVGPNSPQGQQLDSTWRKCAERRARCVCWRTTSSAILKR